MVGTIATPDRGPTYRKTEPKSSSSRRTVPVAGFAAAALQRLLGASADAGSDALLFTTRTRAPVSPGNERWTWRAIRSQDMLADLEDVTPHALRRTVATMLAAELSPEYAAIYLGDGHGTATLFAQYVKYITEVDIGGGDVLNGLMPRAPEP